MHENVKKVIDLAIFSGQKLLKKESDFKPIILFICEDKDRHIYSLPIPGSNRCFEKNVPHKAIRAFIKEQWEMVSEQFDFIELYAVMTFSDTWYTVHYLNNQPPEQAMKDYEDGKIERPSKSPHRIEALVIVINQADNDTIIIKPYDRTPHGIVFGPDFDSKDNDAMFGRLQRLHPERELT